MRARLTRFLIQILACGCFAGISAAQQKPASTDILMPNPQPYPSVACTAQELARLREAYRASGPEHATVAKRVEQADQALRREVVFPPEGGQHNQWYQCEQCQLALETVDPKHHRCPNCGKIYTGYPYDNVIYSRTHDRLTRDLSVCGWAYALTSDEQYAQRARDILVGYAERYSAYPYHSADMGKITDRPSRSGGHVFEQTLNEASWMEEVCDAYDLVRESKSISAADHQAIRDDLLLKVYQNLAKHKAGKSNWQTYHNAAFILIGGVLNRADLVRPALEDKENGFYFQMRASVLPGGMWYENSWGYHFYTLAAVERITETARRLGLDLYSVPQVRDMFEVALDYRMADGTLPRFGDATTTRIPGGLYEAAYHHWHEPNFLALLPEAPTWDSLLYGRKEKPARNFGGLQSSLKVGAGHALLRAGNSTAAFTFGPFGGFHGHFDKLSFVYFSQGQELGFDPGRARSQAYRLPVHKNWYRATTSHNTVLVDRTSQQGAEGQHELFIDTTDLSAVAAHCDQGYPGVTHHRLLVLRPDFLLVADLLNATDGKTHTFDWLYHNRGKGITSPSSPQSSAPPEGQGFDYFKDVHRGTNDSLTRASVRVNANRVDILMNGQAGSELLTGTGVGESILDRIPLFMVTRRGQTARFAATIEAAAQDQPGLVDAVDVQDQGTTGLVIHVRLRTGVDELYAYDPTGAARTVANIETHSKLLCLRRDTPGAYKVVTAAAP
jgi:oligo-alginate lyase